MFRKHEKCELLFFFFLKKMGIMLKTSSLNGKLLLIILGIFATDRMGCDYTMCTSMMDELYTIRSGVLRSPHDSCSLSTQCPFFSPLLLPNGLYLKSSPHYSVLMILSSSSTNLLPFIVIPLSVSPRCG